MHYDFVDPEISFIPAEDYDKKVIQDDDVTTCVTSKNNHLLITLKYQTAAFSFIEFDIAINNTKCSNVSVLIPSFKRKTCPTTVLGHTCPLVVESDTNCSYRCDCDISQSEDCTDISLLVIGHQSQICDITATNYRFY